MARGRRLKRWLLAGARVCLLTMAIGFVVFEVVVAAGDFDPRHYPRPADSHRVTDSDDRLIREAVAPDGMRHRWTALERISPTVVAATVATEDARFYDHDGVDWPGVFRAAGDALVHGRIRSGASTLTMQLARNLEPHDKGLGGKLFEMVLARRIEAAWGKDRILEEYLNRVYYGSGAVGAETASWRYFGRPSRELNTGEAALIAGLPGAPSKFDPHRHLDAAMRRQRWVLWRMADSGALSWPAYWRALADPIRVVPPRAAAAEALHFTDWVAAGSSGDAATSLDSGLQREVEAMVAEHAATHGALGARHAAAVVLDNEGCQVLAMVGSPDYWGRPAGAINGALAARQPGSTLKPFAYALAFEDGAHAGTVVADVPTRYGGEGALNSPRNYGRRTHGPVMMGDALARSLNIPAVRVTEQVGVGRLLGRLRMAGLDSLTQGPEYYGLGLVLGNGEVTLLELAQAYASFARGGRTCRATWRRAGSSGGERAFTPEVAALVTSILGDEARRAEAFGPRNALMVGSPVAVKTGTSANWRDNWAVGYTDTHTIAVWVGDFTGAELQLTTGASGAGPLFARVFERVRARFGPTALPGRDVQLARVEVCALSGKHAGPWCPHRRAVLAVHPEDVHDAGECTWHREIAIDRRNGLLAGPACPEAQVERRLATRLPGEYLEWQALTGQPAPVTEFSPLCPADGAVAGAIVVTWPRPGDQFVLDPGVPSESQKLKLVAKADPAPDALTWVVDGQPIGRAGWPYALSWELSPGPHVVEAVASGRRSEPVRITVR